MTRADTNSRSAVIDGIRTYGGDLGRWPDRALAREAGTAALADRGVRVGLDEARTLDRGLAGARKAIDAEIVAGGVAERVTSAVSAEIRPRPFGRLQWIAAAAVIIFAAGLGSLADFRFAGAVDEPPVNLVVVDPLVFGPMMDDN